EGVTATARPVRARPGAGEPAAPSTGLPGDVGEQVTVPRLAVDAAVAGDLGEVEAAVGGRMAEVVEALGLDDLQPGRFELGRELLVRVLDLVVVVDPLGHVQPAH